MRFDIALNLVWALLGAVALGALSVSELKRGQASVTSRIRRGVAVLIATVALFPCISASDDLVCLAQLHLRAPAGARVVVPPTASANPRPGIGLALRLESLENFQISNSSDVAVTLALFASVQFDAVRGYDRPVPSLSNRAPPRAPLPV